MRGWPGLSLNPSHLAARYARAPHPRSADGLRLRRRSSFVRLAATIRADREAIAATLTHRLSNARMEGADATIRLITRRAYGFTSTSALVSLVMLTLGGLCPPLPGRSLT